MKKSIITDGSGNTFVLLPCSFALTIVLMIAITYNSLSHLNIAQSRIDEIVLIHNKKSALISAMQHAHRERVINLQRMFITDDFFGRDEAALNNMQMANQFVHARSVLESMESTPEEQALLVEMRQLASIGAPLNDEIRDILWHREENSVERAKMLLTQDFLPVQNQLYATFDSLIAFYGMENNKAIEACAREFYAARNLLLSMLAMAVTLSLATALYVTNVIFRKERALTAHRNTLESLVEERTTELRCISIEALIARREAEEANNAKSTFMANMSHELRTPLNAILGFSEIMDLQIMGPMPERYREYPRHIHGSATHLLQMIEQLLDLSRIEAGHLELRETEVSIMKLLAETANVVVGAFSRQDGSIEIRGNIAQVMIHGDARFLKQTLINIVSNAAKYSDADDPIEISVSAADGPLILTIRDHGMGIAAEEIPRLFNPYERSEAQTARERQGTGLGLAIARSLVEAHDGTLTLESVLDEGTVVTITLPAERILRIDDSAVASQAITG